MSRSYQGEPGEDQVEGLIEHLDMDPELARERVGRTIDEPELDGTVDSLQEERVRKSRQILIEVYENEHVRRRRTRSTIDDAD